MGGRGASSGISKQGNPYGSQYHALFTVGNIKFVAKNTRQSEPLMETMTKGRVYVQVGGEELKSIHYFGNDGKRVKQINLDHVHKKMQPHTHHGYEHREYEASKKGASRLTTEEKAMVDRVIGIWEDYLGKR